MRLRDRRRKIREASLSSCRKWQTDPSPCELRAEIEHGSLGPMSSIRNTHIISGGEADTKHLAEIRGYSTEKGSLVKWLRPGYWPGQEQGQGPREWENARRGEERRGEERRGEERRGEERGAKDT
jgi:hypothetical protein